MNNDLFWKRLMLSGWLCCMLFLGNSYAQPSVPQREGNYATHSVLASGKWYKVGVEETGVYRLSYSDLSALGMDVAHIDPRNLRVYHNGGGVLNELNAQPRFDDLVELPIEVAGEADGSFDANDYVLFYARGPVTWTYDTRNKIYVHTPNAYDDASYAFITADLGRGLRIAEVASPLASAPVPVTEFHDYQRYEKDNYNLINGGRTYYGDIMDGNSSLSLDFDFPNIVRDRSCKVKVNLAGRNFSTAKFQIYVNNTLAQTYFIEQTAPGSDHAFANPVTGLIPGSVAGDRVNVQLQHSGVPGTTSIGYVDYVTVNAWRSLRYVGPELAFRNPEAVEDTVVYQYRISNANSALRVWNVTDSIHPVAVQGTMTGSEYRFNVNGSPRNAFIAFDGSSYHSPSLLGTVDNQDLHGDRNYDYLMVVYPDFLNQAERLRNIHALYDPELRIKIVTPEQIYNEFSCGAQDVSAIRDYCRMLYHDERPLRYLLLFGDASFDYKNRSGVVNFVPTYEPLAATDIRSSFVTDDYFCFMDEQEGATVSSVPDIGAGRFPVSTVEQATQMVTKVERYLAMDENTMQPWRNTITFMCDDEQRNEFIDHSEYYVSNLKSVGGGNLVVDKIYLDAFKQENTPGGQLAPEVNAAINSRMEKGTLVLNYVGHGGEVQLADERILQRSDVNSWRNGPKYPLMITGTCEFSRYDDHTRTSLGEYAFLNQYGGMIAMFTTSRITYGGYNKTFITNVYSHLFEMEQGERRRLGDVFRMAKPEGAWWERIYVFFGDPALRLPMPKWTVETTSFADTVRSLQHVTLEGVVKDGSGQVAGDFNGIVYVSVYDKENNYVTYGDHETAVREFGLYNSLIFNGKTEVTDGHFQLDFIVPRDISYRFGNGMISYYATDYTNEASGRFEDFIIGGFNENAEMDEAAPEIRLFVDDEKFVNGGITSDNPLLLAYVEDESGINTTGTGIGHDIVATLTGPSNKTYILNDYFVAEIGKQGKGTIMYRMQDLEEGSYTLSLKVWDIFNNSSTASIEFTVVSSDRMALEDPLCIPNPVKDYADFSFGHNQIGNNMEVEIDIYDVMGRLVAVLKEQVLGTSARTYPIHWDGCATNGQKLRSGLYIYRIVATNDKGESAGITSKLVITD